MGYSTLQVLVKGEGIKTIAHIPTILMKILKKFLMSCGPIKNLN